MWWNYIKINTSYYHLVLNYFCLSCAYELYHILVGFFWKKYFFLKFFQNFCAAYVCVVAKSLLYKPPAVPPLLRHCVYVLHKKWHIVTHCVSLFPIWFLIHVFAFWPGYPVSFSVNVGSCCTNMDWEGKEPYWFICCGSGMDQGSLITSIYLFVFLAYSVTYLI